MNRALWKKALGEVRLILPAFALLMFAFQIMFVWLTSQVDLHYVQIFLQSMPETWRRLLPVSAETMTTYAGRVAFGFDHPIVVFGTAYWAIARGSDAVSGPLDRGTLELVLAQARHANGRAGDQRLDDDARRRGHGRLGRSRYLGRSSDRAQDARYLRLAVCRIGD